MRIEGFAENKINITTKDKSENKNVVSSSNKIESVSFTTNDIMKNSVLEKTANNNNWGSDGTLESLKNDAKMLKDNLSSIFNKMDTGTAVKMNEEGMDINNADNDTVVSVVEKIQIQLAMYCDDFIPNMNIDIEDIKKTVGSAEMAYNISSKFNEYNINPSEKDVSEALLAVDKWQSIGEITENTKAYLLKNNMTPSIQNIYKASHSGYITQTNNIDDMQWEQMKPQVEGILRDANIEVTPEAVELGKWMVNNGIEVQADNYTTLENLEIPSDEIDKIDRVVSTMIEGYSANKTLVTGESLPWEETVQAIETLSNATLGNIMALSQSNKIQTLEALSDVIINTTEVEPEENNYKYSKSLREIQEIRLMMTIDAGRTMEKAGVSINTIELSELVDQLREYEKNYLNGKIANEDASIKVQDIIQTNNVMLTINDAKVLPMDVLGDIVSTNKQASINNFIESGAEYQNKMVAVGHAYEALSTEIRVDLGDSLSNAIDNSTMDILLDLGIEETEGNKRAIRILANNNMDINMNNIEKVKNIDYSVNQLFENMSPEIAMKMIKTGINPLETGVDELNAYIIEESSSQISTEEKYSEFLYKMEKNKDITPEEREKFINLYGVINKFQKDDMNVVGSMIQQNLDLTMGNLLTAYMSRKDQGMEIIVDDSNGAVEANDKITYLKNLFGGIANKITPEQLVSMEQDLDNMPMEQFGEQIESADDISNNLSQDRMMETITHATEVEESVLKIITDHQIGTSFNNILAAEMLVNQPFTLFKKIIQEENKEEVHENIILNSLEGKKEMESVYNGLMNDAKTLIQDAMYTTDSYMDMESLRQIGNGMNLLNELAKRNTYEIPYDNDGTIGVIHLKIVDDENDAGQFSIKFNSNILGNVTVQGKIGNNKLYSQVMSDYQEAIVKVQEKVDIIERELKEIGLENTIIKVSNIQEQPDVQSVVKENVETDIIYKVAKIFILNLTKISK